MSLFVAVTLVPVLCSRLLVLPPPADQAHGHLGGRLYTFSERLLNGMDDGYRRLLHLALEHRPSVVALAPRRSSPPWSSSPRLPTEFATQADEGQVKVNVELRAGHAHRGHRPVLRRLEESIGQLVPEATDVIVQRGRRRRPGGFGGGGSASAAGNLQLLLTPKDERTRSSEQIAMDLRRQLSGIPGVIVRANAVGRQQPAESSPLGRQQRRRAPLARDPRRGPRRLRGGSRKSPKDLLDTMPGVADARLGRDDGRPELAVRVDRAKAALLGISATTLANTIRTNVAGTQAALYRQPGQRIPDHRPPARGRAAGRRPTSKTCWSARRRDRCCRPRT